MDNCKNNNIVFTNINIINRKPITDYIEIDETDYKSLFIQQ